MRVELIDWLGSDIRMDLQHGRYHFTTFLVASRDHGSTSLQLHKELDGATTVAAEVVFYDAAGQFFVQTFGTDVPLQVIEALIAEARFAIKVR